MKTNVIPCDLPTIEERIPKLPSLKALYDQLSVCDLDNKNLLDTLTAIVAHVHRVEDKLQKVVDDNKPPKPPIKPRAAPARGALSPYRRKFPPDDPPPQDEL